MRLYLIRHGESGNNALDGQMTDYAAYLAARSPDPLLTEMGERQAQCVADHLASNGYGITEVHCSAMTRAMQTAQPIGRALSLNPRVWLDIHEHGGVFLGNPRNGDVRGFPGLTRQEASERFPGYLLPEEMTEEGWYRGGYEDMNRCDIRARRVATALTERAAHGDSATLALVSHGTFIDRLLKALFRQTDSDAGYFYFLNNTSITHLELTVDGPIVLRFTNQVAHLPEEMITQ